MTQPSAEPPIDVEVLHRAVAHGPLGREQPEPSEGLEPTPWWLWALATLSIFVGGFYLGRYSGPFSARPHTGFTPTSRAAEVERPELAEPPSGAELYASRCAACHQADGKGLAGSFPPLVGSELVVGPAEVPISIVLLGLAGPIDVAGARYDGSMPSWKQLADDEIARILSHVRGLSGAPPVDAATVAAVRQATATAPSPLSAADLRALMK